MSTITELRCPVLVNTPKGEGMAYWLLDAGPNADILWGVVITETQQVWWTKNSSIMVSNNWSYCGDNSPSHQGM